MTDDKLKRANELKDLMSRMDKIMYNCSYPYLNISYSGSTLNDIVSTDDEVIKKGLYELASTRYQELKEEYDNL